MRKSINALIATLLVFMLVPLTTLAQEGKTQKFVVHEDVVKPHKMMAYEKASKAFVATLKEHAGPEAHFMAMSSDDMRYIFISPIDNMAALDKNPFAKLEESLGKEATKEVFESWNGMFETHYDYILNLNPALSYNSGEIMEQGVNFRKIDYYYIFPDKMEEAFAIAKEWKELHANNNIASGYRVYSGGMGTEPMLMVVSWAKDAVQMEQNSMKVRETLGEAGQELYARTLALTKRMESITGWMRPDLSYMPDAPMADN